MHPRVHRKTELETLFTDMISGIAAEAETIEYHGTGFDEMNGGAFRDIVYISPAERTRLVAEYTHKAEVARQLRELETYRVMMRRAVAILLGGLIDVGVPGYTRSHPDISFPIRDKPQLTEHPPEDLRFRRGIHGPCFTQIEPTFPDYVRAAAEAHGLNPVQAQKAAEAEAGPPRIVIFECRPGDIADADDEHRTLSPEDGLFDDNPDRGY